MPKGLPPPQVSPPEGVVEDSWQRNNVFEDVSEEVVVLPVPMAQTAVEWFIEEEQRAALNHGPLEGAFPARDMPSSVGSYVAITGEWPSGAPPRGNNPKKDYDVLSAGVWPTSDPSDSGKAARSEPGNRRPQREIKGYDRYGRPIH